LYNAITLIKTSEGKHKRFNHGESGHAKQPDYIDSQAVTARLAETMLQLPKCTLRQVVATS